MDLVWINNLIYMACQAEMIHTIAPCQVNEGDVRWTHQMQSKNNNDKMNESHIDK